MTTSVFEEHLQHIAEQLARNLHRSVIIDDAALRPLAITAQTGRLDRSRVEAVLQRQTSARLRRKLTEHGVFSAREPVSIPGDPQQATLPRLCLPLRADDQLLGFLWLIDQPALTTEQTRQAQAAGAQAAHLLAQRAIQADSQFAMLSDLADGLLHPQEQARQEAAAMLAGQAAPAGPPPYALAVIRPVADRPTPASDPGRAAGKLSRAAANLRLRTAPGALVLASPGEGELVAITTAGALTELRRAVRSLPGPPLAVAPAAAPQRWPTCTPAWVTPSTPPTWLHACHSSGGPPTGRAWASTRPSSTSPATGRRPSGSAPASEHCCTSGPEHTARPSAATLSARHRPSRPPRSCTSTGQRCTGGWHAWPS